MEIKLFNYEKEELVNLLCSNDWMYHSGPKVKPEVVQKSVDNGYYSNGRETFWIIIDHQKVGIIIIDDIDDTIPLFDLRLAEGVRGKNIGTQVLLWLKEYLFGEKEKVRIEGYTRADNHAMRKCFVKAGFVKEGYLRNAWENDDGTIFDTVLYGAIFDDWKENKITPSKIDAFPY